MKTANFKIVWTVGAAPTGRYRSFQERSWPRGDFNHRDGKSAAMITCEDAYRPAKVKTGEHAELIVWVAKYYIEKETGRELFDWKQLKNHYATLPEAKAAVVRFYEQHLDYMPKELKTA